MKLIRNTIVGFRLPVTAGYILLSMFLATSAGAQYTHYGSGIDLQSPLSHDIMELLSERCPQLWMEDLEMITSDVQLAANDYSEYFVEPSLLLALMSAEEIYPDYPQARLYFFNLDMGSLADEAIFPEAWFDAERVARSYSAEYQRYKDKTASIAAYFVGHQQIPTNGDISGQDEGLIELVGMVLRMDAEWSHLGEKGGPQVVTFDKETPQSSFEYPEYDTEEVERAYIQNMMYFNPRLDSSTAQEIFQAIHRHASDYQTVDARLVMALVACESNFRPEAVSRCGAQGLGQLMPFTSERFGVSDPFDVDENIRATFAYLARELERWASSNYTLDRILAAYNAGPNAVEQYTDPPYNGIPPYQETVNYVPKVVRIYFAFLPKGEQGEKLSGQTRYVVEENGSVQLSR